MHQYLLYDKSTGAVHTSRDIVFVKSWQLKSCPYKPGKILGSSVPDNEAHGEGWPKPVTSAPIALSSSPSVPTSTSPSPVSLSAFSSSSSPQLVLSPSSSSTSSSSSSSSSSLPSHNLIDFDTPLSVPSVSSSDSTSVATPNPSPPATPSPSPSGSKQNKKNNLHTTPSVPTPSRLTLSHDHDSKSVPLLRHSKHIADLLAARIQSGRRRTQRACYCACKGSGLPSGDAYAAALNGNCSSDKILALLAYAIEDKDVSVAEVFSEMLDTNLVDLAYALDVESDDQEEPSLMKQALSGPDCTKWRQALLEELQAIADLGVFRLVSRRDVPAGRRILTGKPVFKIKRDENGNPIRWEARWVVKGFLQVFGVDYNKTTPPTARLKMFRLLCHIMASEGLAMRQFDVKTAFLHGKLPPDKRVFMQQPPGFKDSSKPDHVWMLVKALYGMKQAGRVWNHTFNNALVNDFGFRRVMNEHCLYVRSSPGGGFAMASIHVDNTFAIGLSEEELDQLQRNLESKWEISVGDGSFILGIHLECNLKNHLVHLSQTALINCIVEKFGQQKAADVWTPMESGIGLSKANCPSTAEEKSEMANVPYRKLVGSINYIGQATQPDIVYAVRRLSKFLANTGRKHWDAAIRVLQYLKTTCLYRLTLGGTVKDKTVQVFSSFEKIDLQLVNKQYYGYT
jgi:hypothetical protein